MPLLERSPQGVAMTEAGERLYARARRLVADMEDLTERLDEIRGSIGTVHLAISHTAAEFVMPRALVLMRHRTSAPIEVLIANSRVVKHMVLTGQADVGVAACMSGESTPGLELVPLIEDEIVIAVPLAHPWARRRSVSASELLATPIVLRDPGAHTRQAIDEALTAGGFGALTAACEVGSTQAAKDDAHELGLPTAISRLALSPADRLEIVAVEGLRFKRRFCLVHQPGALSAGVGHLLEAFREAVARERPQPQEPGAR